MSEESYLVLARKKRPQKFSEVTGQEHVTKTLQNALKTGRIAHAFLLTGTRGIGKTTTARILAKALNCEERTTEEPCDKCQNCKAISAGSSLDVIEIDGASNRRIGEVRELREKAKFAPVQSRFKVYIIDEVHMLTTEAFNALLKTLEEPPPHVKFILATTDPNKLPATILSRCQRYDFKTLSDDAVVRFLSKIATEENIDIEEEAVNILARSASGSVRDALSVFESIISFSERGKITAETVKDILGVVDTVFLAEIIKGIIDNDASSIVKLSAELSERGYDINSFCEYFLKFIRDIIVISSGGHTGNLSQEGADLKENLAREKSFDEWLMLFNLFYECSKEIKRADNPFIVLEVSLLKCMRSRVTMPLDDIIKKLSSEKDESEKDFSPARQSREDKRNFSQKSPSSYNSSPETGIQEITEESSFDTEPPAQSMSGKWTNFLTILEKKSIILNSIFSNGCRKVYDDKVLRIILGDEFTLTTVNMGNHFSILNEAVKKTFGKNVKLKIEVEKNEKECNGEDIGVKVADRESLMNSAMNDDAVKTILDLFPSRIVNIKN